MSDFNYKELINKSTVLQSLLYDLDLLPEQIDKPSHDFDRMILICAHFEASETRAIKAEAELKEEQTALGYIMLILETNDPMKAVAELKAERDELKALLGRVKEYILEHKTDCETSIHGASELCTCHLSAILAQIDGIVGEGNV